MTAAPLLELVQDSRPARFPRQRPPRASVRRPRLVEALAFPDGPPLAVVVAPAGFGKTTLLSEWAARDPRPFAWVTLDAGHEDPTALLRAVTRAIDAASASAPDGRAVLVLDDLHAVR